MRLYLCLAMLLTTPSVLGGFVDFNGQFTVKVSSIAEQRFKTIYKQKYDFSCGSATLASLLSFHYDDVVNELSVFKDMFEHGNKAKIKHQGFSLLDMKRYLSRRGYQANGFNISLEQLSSAQIPAITIINNNGYMHFVIIKGSTDKEVLVGDPAIGLKSVRKDKFEDMWGQRIVFVIQDRKEIAVNHYKHDQKSDHQVRANLGLAIDHASLGLLNVLQPSSMDF
ncbi:C39 family peptidase [Paraglaciecola sp. L1A13]|uniref:C39 family peptidase n=1 Tax=Paraglaciecola sp. L1A13 TaxID=2686359 RepID=UPI00131C9005|nr:C39 family peptidase [Paraglaciecola sp. L1A13]